LAVARGSCLEQRFFPGATLLAAASLLNAQYTPLMSSLRGATTMDQRPREYILEVFADQTFVKDIVKGTVQLLVTFISPLGLRSLAAASWPC